MEKEAWWKESVVYQIYPRSFKDSNGDGIGDLNGITEKLSYLEKLGVDVLWLSPIFQSPNDDNGYDISDYQNIMTEFGTMKDFDRFLKEAHVHHLKIMLDLVVNHTSDEHRWFVESKSSKDSAYRDYYIWKEPVGGEPLNHWQASFGGSVWEFDEKTGMYYLHMFSKKQPDLNWENPAVRNDIFAMMDWWLKKGIDGFRMDVINMISKAPGFPEGKPIEGTSYTDGSPFVMCGPKVHEYLQEMNKKVLSNYDIMTVGETPGITVQDGELFTGEDRHELNMVFHFEHVDVENGNKTKWTDKRFEMPKLREILFRWQTELQNGWNSLYWNNHDQPRVVSRFGNDKKYWKESAKMLATCLHMMRGTPYIYQGEEIGMTNVCLDTVEEYPDIETKGAYDTFVRKLGVSDEEMMRAIHARGRDNARTPMQWDDSLNAGFTTGTPWFSANENYKTINTASQLEDPASIFSYYKKLIALRHEKKVIVYGDFTPWMEESKEVLSYMRSLDGTTILVVNNFSEEEVSFLLPERFKEKKAELLIGNYVGALSEKLRAYEARVYEVRG